MNSGAKNILITGGTGLVGSKLVGALRAEGHFVRLLVRDQRVLPSDEVFYWNVKHQKVDPACLDGIDTIIHLAGAGIADKRWTAKRKQEIVDSRVKSIAMLYHIMRTRGIKVQTIISASGVGYYGNSHDEVLFEDRPCGTGFLADCCRFWENAVESGRDLCERMVKLRIGIVLARKGGALAELERPVRLFFGAALGNGEQWMPWIHIDDMVRLFCSAVSSPAYKGVYNACSPQPVTNLDFIHTLAKRLNRPVWPLKVPVFVLRLILGEMAEVVLVSSRASSQRLVDAGFKFRFTQLTEAFGELYSR